MVPRAHIKWKDTHIYAQTLERSGDPTVPLWEGNMYSQHRHRVEVLMFPEGWGSQLSRDEFGARALLVLRGT